jgi:FMN phosphatase YigB (HAD superfamily)
MTNGKPKACHDLQMTNIVCFDLGAVLVQIAHTWQDAARIANVTIPASIPNPWPRAANPDLHAFEAGEITYEIFIARLAVTLGISENDARAVQASVLNGEYPDTPAFVQEVREAGWRVGCLSNTSPAHWAKLTDASSYPTVAKLEIRLASNEIACAKPDMGAYLAFERAANANPTEIIFFDDSSANVQAAIARGWRAFQVTDLKYPSRQMRQVLVGLGLREIS